jgi:hypothetical protein
VFIVFPLWPFRMYIWPGQRSSGYFPLIVGAWHLCCWARYSFMSCHIRSIDFTAADYTSWCEYCTFIKSEAFSTWTEVTQGQKVFQNLYTLKGNYSGILKEFEYKHCIQVLMSVILILKVCYQVPRYYQLKCIHYFPQGS